MEVKNGRNRSDDSALTTEIQNSNMAIADLMNDGTDMVLNVQIANDLREIKRREEEQTLRKRRTAFLEEEAAKAEAGFHEIFSQWESISKFNDSVDIYNALEDQTQKYAELIGQKNEIISALKKELADADERFVEDQELQKEEIDILTDRIDEHIKIMKNAYRTRLELIEDTAEKQCKLKLHEKHSEWLNANEALKQRGIKELNEKFRTVEDYETRVTEMIWDHYEQYRGLKKNLETELQNQQIILEETKAFCLINEKKLEYNYLILSKRREELGQVKARQRKQIISLQDELISLQTEILKSEKEHEARCKKLHDEISKLESISRDLSQKQERLDSTNENTFKQIWKLNEERARKLLDKILKTDKLLHEKVLHMEWNPPSFSFMKISELPSVRFALRHVPDFQLQGLDAENINEKSSTEIKITEYPQLSPNYETLKFILQNIAENIKFVISNKIDTLTENLPEEKQSLVCFDNILKVLKIESELELELLRQHFLPYIRCSTCNNKTTRLLSKKPAFPCISHLKYGKAIAASKRTGSGNKLRGRTVVTGQKRPASTPGRRTTDSISCSPSPRSICDNPKHSWYLDQFTVIKTLSEYMKDKKEREIQEKNVKFRKIPLSRILSLKDIELYWSAFLFKSMEDFKNLWDVLLPGLQNFKKLIKEQNTIRDETKRLEKQNSELKRALKYFTEGNRQLDKEGIQRC